MCSLSLPSCSSQFIPRQMWDRLVHQPLPCLVSFPPWLPAFALLPVSTPPTILNEYFFFNSLVVGLPYSSIFWQFWLVNLNLLFSSFWLREEAKCVYLCLHFGWKFICGIFFFNTTHSLDVYSIIFFLDSHVCGQRNNPMFSKRPRERRDLCCFPLCLSY